MNNTTTSCDISMCAEKTPLVSIVIPVYNVSRYLAQCLESVIHQSYHNIEIIIIDDGSTDGSGSLCDSFARSDDRIRVFHTENRGLASARNLGMEKCTGSYLMFIDSDDWIELHTVETLLNFAQKYNADIVAAKRDLEFVGKTIHSTEQEKNARVIHGDEILNYFGKGQLTDTVWN